AAEPVEEFVPVPGVVFTCLGHCDMLDVHPVVPASLELTGYPFNIYSIERLYYEHASSGPAIA
ncbi:MAG: hypothetical protein M3Z15_07055, partial [Pseudomonadota bacterium]|nr:hypothetical protein [Pseudomonadota bacterium]